MEIGDPEPSTVVRTAWALRLMMSVSLLSFFDRRKQLSKQYGQEWRHVKENFSHVLSDTKQQTELQPVMISEQPRMPGEVEE